MVDPPNESFSAKKPEKLKVWEGAEHYYVVYEASDQDWIAKFDKSWAEAKKWADHMADVHNARVNEKAEE